MILLAVDTALDACAAAVAFPRDGAVEVVSITEVIGRGHAERLMQVVGAALEKAGLRHADLDGYAVSIGPGSFTGIRVGVAATRGFALAAGKPAVAVTSLEALATEARALRPGRPVLAVLDARKDEVYAQGFAADGTPVAPPVVVARRTAAGEAVRLGAVLIGSGAGLLVALEPSLEIAADTAFPSIVTIARLALPRLAGATVGRDLPAPSYVRAPDAKPQGAARLARLTPARLAPDGLAAAPEGRR